MGLREWWQNRTWDYLGYCEMHYVNADGSKEDAGVLHFYAWRPNQKRRYVRYSKTTGWDREHLRQSTWYQTHIVPWLAGGALWDPITHPKPVRGTLIDKFSAQQKQIP